MDIEAGAETAVDELGIGCFIALFTPILCCLLPARYQWKSLSEKEQLKIVVCASIVVGNVDYALDITVAKNWFEDGDVWWGALICVSISLSGLVSWYYRACHMDKGKLDEANLSEFEPTSLDWKLLPLFLLGLGSIYDAIMVVMSGFDDKRTFEFQSTRLMEIMLESLPSGTLQIYVSVLRNDWHKWLESASIAASLLSVGWGLMTATSRGIYCDWKTDVPKWSILCFCLCDFISNSLSLAVFISLKSFRAFSMYIFFPIIMLVSIGSRAIMNWGFGYAYFQEGVIDGIVWTLLGIISSARLVISPMFWERDTNKSLLLRFIANLAFFLITVIVDITNESDSFSSYLPYYVGIFICTNVILLISIVRLTGNVHF